MKFNGKVLGMVLVVALVMLAAGCCCERSAAQKAADRARCEDICGHGDSAFERGCRDGCR